MPSKRSGCRSRVEDALTAAAAREGAVSWRAAVSSGPSERQDASAADRPRRASADRRRDGAVRVMLKPRALSSGRPPRRRRAGQLLSGARSSTQGIAEIRRLGFEPVYDDSVFAKHGEFVAGTAEARAAAITRPGGIRPSPGSSAFAADTGARRCCRFSIPATRAARRKPFIGYSDLTSVLTFLTMNCGMVAFHGPMLDGRLGRGELGYDEPSF